MIFKKKKWEIDEDGEKVMSLSDHLRELRNRVIVCLLILAIGFVFCFYNAETIVNELTTMGLNNGYSFVYLSPQELLLQYMRIGLVGGLILSIPVLVYEVYAFIAPGLEKYEKPFLILSLIFGQICFVIGVIFAHKISMPFMLGFLFKVNSTDYITSSISIESYLSFILTVYIIFGAVFEMPVISAILTKFGLLKSKWLEKGRSVSIVICFLVAALITPPDVISQVMVAIPMMLLYQISILICKLIEKLNRKKEEAE
ncbi:MAG: twin-arginine translocase subunit TatC, partial [Erysipelotrichaceae bacterium]